MEINLLNRANNIDFWWGGGGGGEILFWPC